MPCPFCDSLLDKYEFEGHSAYECENKACLNDDMPRYKMVFIHGRNLSETVMFEEDGFYVQIDHAVNRTIISRLEACVLLDSITLPKALDFNKYEYDCLPKLLSKVKMLMVFS
jgi:hypothetical protein